MHLERLADTAASELGEDFAANGLLNSISSNTHDHGGMLDIVVCRSGMPMPHVDVVDVGVSDHRLLSWSVPMVRESPVYTSTAKRSWKRLYTVAFRSALEASPLCSADAWSELDNDGLAQLYDTETTEILDPSPLCTPSVATSARPISSSSTVALPNELFSFSSAIFAASDALIRRILLTSMLLPKSGRIDAASIAFCRRRCRQSAIRLSNSGAQSTFCSVEVASLRRSVSHQTLCMLSSIRRSPAFAPRPAMPRRQRSLTFHRDIP